VIHTAMQPLSSFKAVLNGDILKIINSNN